MTLIGIVLLVVGWLFHHWVERRKFYRRDVLGNDIHPSYGGMLVTRLLESVAGFIGGTASLVGFLIVAYQALKYFGFLH